MRTNQIAVRVLRKPHADLKSLAFEERREIENNPLYKLVGVYADANNFYEAFCAAYNETANEVRRRSLLGDTCVEETDIFSDKIEVAVTIYYSELLNPKFGSQRTFSAVSKDVYEALTNAFNNVLCEAQKLIALPTFGRKEHYPCADDDYENSKASPELLK